LGERGSVLQGEGLTLSVSGRVHTTTKRARRRRAYSSHRSLEAGSLLLLSQHHSIGRLSPKRYDKRYEDRFLCQRAPDFRRITQDAGKLCMLVSPRMGADLSRGCRRKGPGRSLLALPDALSRRYTIGEVLVFAYGVKDGSSTIVQNTFARQEVPKRALLMGRAQGCCQYRHGHLFMTPNLVPTPNAAMFPARPKPEHNWS